MPQHFLLFSAAARTLSLSAVARMSNEEAHAKFVAIRWADNDGKSYCPECGCTKVYAYATRKLWKCTACRYQFSVTARTIFADRKRPIRDYLLAIAVIPDFCDMAGIGYSIRIGQAPHPQFCSQNVLGGGPRVARLGGAWRML